MWFACAGAPPGGCQSGARAARPFVEAKQALCAVRHRRRLRSRVVARSAQVAALACVLCLALYVGRLAVVDHPSGVCCRGAKKPQRGGEAKAHPFRLAPRPRHADGATSFCCLLNCGHAPMRHARSAWRGPASVAPVVFFASFFFHVFITLKHHVIHTCSLFDPRPAHIATAFAAAPGARQGTRQLRRGR